MNATLEEELIGAEESNLVLKTNSTKCKVCMIGDVVPDEKENKVPDRFMVYTRDGTKIASHLTYRYIITMNF